MYAELVVALDGSPAAEQVLPHAEALAAAFGSHITLLRATLSPEMVLAQAGAGDATAAAVPAPIDPKPVLDADHETSLDYVTRMASQLRAQGLKVDVETPEGPATAVIVERAAALNAELILMTTHGRSGLGRAIFGSTADHVLRHAACPVLLVRISEDGHQV